MTPETPALAPKLVDRMNDFAEDRLMERVNIARAVLALTEQQPSNLHDDLVDRIDAAPDSADGILGMQHALFATLNIHKPHQIYDECDLEVTP